MQEKSKDLPLVNKEPFQQRLDQIFDDGELLEHMGGGTTIEERKPYVRLRYYADDGSGGTAMQDSWFELRDGKWEYGEHNGSRDPVTGMDRPNAIPWGETERPGPKKPENYFPESTRAQHPFGVLYQGEFETPSDGTARAVRMHARALAATGIPVLLRSISGVVVTDGCAEPVFLAGLPAEVEKEVGHLLNTDIAAFRPVIKHVVIRNAEHLRQLLMPRGAVPKDPNDTQQQLDMRDTLYGNAIVYSVWERDRIDPAIAKHLARVKQCWVPCKQNAALLVKSGVPEGSVHVVPHPYDEQDKSFDAHRKRVPGMFRSTAARAPEDRDKGQKRFYSIGRWEPRKNFVQLIQAFMRAFPGASLENVTLTIKYSGNGQWPGYMTVEAAQALVHSCGFSPCIKIIGGTVDRSRISQLHFENNIYVSASHGEAWALPAFDAKLAGNRLVYVPWGGICDFAADDDLPVPHTMFPVDPSYRWEHGAQWADCKLEDLAEALRRVTVPEKYELPAKFEGRFGMRPVGEKMRILVEAATPGKSLVAL